MACIDAINLSRETRSIDSENWASPQIRSLWTRLGCGGGPIGSKQGFRSRSRVVRRPTEAVASSAYSPKTSTRSPRTVPGLLGIPTSGMDVRDPAAYSAVRSRLRPSDHTRATSRTSRNRVEFHRSRSRRARLPRRLEPGSKSQVFDTADAPRRTSERRGHRALERNKSVDW
jgi:hypothetical protein